MEDSATALPASIMEGGWIAPQLHPGKLTTYCWSHGACKHTGAECNRKVEGHQDGATFANMMGGVKKILLAMTV